MSALFAELNLSSLPGPTSIARCELPNGVVGLTYENAFSPSVFVYGWLQAGSIDVPREKAGLASLTASLLTRGTVHRTFAEISEQVESLGATLSVSSSGHTTHFAFKCLVEDLALLFDILTDCLYNPVFPALYLEKRRTEILTAIEQREDSTQVMASLAFHELMYPHHPYGISQLGYRDSIAGLTRDDVVAFYQDHYGPPATVVMVGALEKERGLDMLEAAFGHWQGTGYVRRPLPDVRPLETIQRQYVHVPGKVQSDLLLGWPGMRRASPEFMRAYLANCVLGEFGLMGRVGERVREEQGLAYYVYTALDAGLGAGPWMAAAGIDPGNVSRTVEAILNEVVRLQHEPVDQQELDDNKSYIIGSLPLRLEGNEGIAAQIADMELYQLGLDYLQRFPNLIAALTAEDVMQVAQTFLIPDAYVLAVAGPGQGI